MKTQSEGRQVAGIPDIIGVITGIQVYLELKVRRSGVKWEHDTIPIYKGWKDLGLTGSQHGTLYAIHEATMCSPGITSGVLSYDERSEVIRYFTLTNEPTWKSPGGMLCQRAMILPQELLTLFALSKV